MILSGRFSLWIEISGNVLIYKNKSGIATSVQIICVGNVFNQNTLKCKPRKMMPGATMQVSKTNDFLLNVWYIFLGVHWMLWKSHCCRRNTHVRNFPRPNLLEIWSTSWFVANVKFRIFLSFKMKACQENKTKYRCIKK